VEAKGGESALAVSKISVFRDRMGTEFNQLLDHLVRKDEQVRGHRQIEGLGGSEVDDEFKLPGCNGFC